MLRVSGFWVTLLSFQAHGVALCDPDILCWWRRWYNMSDFLDEQGELYTLEAFGAEELARMEEEKEL
ncbi:hypothetical protein RHMOL_Rhmol07G0195400 [Rhododendron molle]|uniref:Uncharacterized protein n=1 Tax=Rhododendron molle TaxID=49168 RepID=A0ACC0N444_RHOML|nr:hypothetical protein RHMOL_Rhmol07G0195400 [Rhododendron molle]